MDQSWPVTIRIFFGWFFGLFSASCNSFWLSLCPAGAVSVQFRMCKYQLLQNSGAKLWVLQILVHGDENSDFHGKNEKFLEFEKLKDLA